MAKATTAWGIDIGQCALKALKLRDVEGQLQVEAFDIIEHPKILSQPDADRQQLIQEALQQFLARNNTSGSDVVISVPGQSSFSRFVKLPPVESKRIPDIVRFEAEQQIPFPINEVIWRWQIFRDPDSPDVEVGLFAMKRMDVAEMLHHFNEVDLTIDTVQMAPLALYNFMTYDGQLAADGATLLADVGADKTDLVVADKGRIWTRTIQIGGNNFTEALVRTFKLSFDKAEKLKRTAASSKYARQIFQSMRPVFADLVQEIQRSVGYYTSLHRDTRFRRLLGLGNGFRLPGLQKFIEQNLNIPVARIDSYNKLTPSATVNAPTLNEHVLSCAVAYGLALQGLGVSVPDTELVATNLLPGEILRKRLWNRKRPWFIAAAVVLLASLYCAVYRANVDSQTLADRTALRQATAIQRDISNWNRQYAKTKGEGGRERQTIEKKAKLFQNRDFWMAATMLVDRSIEAVALDQPLLADYGRSARLDESQRELLLGRDPDALTVKSAEAVDKAAGILLTEAAAEQLRAKLASDVPTLRAWTKNMLAEAKDPNEPLKPAAVDALAAGALRNQAKRLMLANKIRAAERFKARKRNTRRVIVVEKLTTKYTSDVTMDLSGTSSFGRRRRPRPTGGAKEGFVVELTGRTPLPQTLANSMLANMGTYSIELAKWLGPVSVHDHRAEFLPAPAVTVLAAAKKTGPRMPDPAMPDEDMVGDTRFKFTWCLAVTGDGVTMRQIEPGVKYVLARPVDLLPSLDPPESDPNDPVKSLATKTIPAKGTIVVQPGGVQTRLLSPWYKVKASDAEGKSVWEGWVSGEALEKNLQQPKRS